MSTVQNSERGSATMMSSAPEPNPPVILVTSAEANLPTSIVVNEAIEPVAEAPTTNEKLHDQQESCINNNNNDISYEPMIIKANLNHRSQNNNNNDNNNNINNNEDELHQMHIISENDENMKDIDIHDINLFNKNNKNMDTGNSFALSSFVEPPEMSDDDQMFAAFNHFQIIWSDLSYKIEPKWYKKYNFLNRIMGGSCATATPDSSANVEAAHAGALRSSCSVISSINLNANQAASGKLKRNLGGARSTSPRSPIPSAKASTATTNQVDNKTIEIFSNLNGTIKSGQLTAILGPSGAGKTSLLNCLTGKLRKGVSGHINLVGALGKQLKICTIPQKDHLLDLLTVEENLWFASKIKNPQCGFDHANNIGRVVELLGLRRCRGAKIKKISGGQHKRVSIAQELLSNPDILVLDEPTSGLDSLTCYKTISMLRDLVELSANSEYLEPMAIIVTIHQPQPKVFNLFHHVYILANGGRIIYEGDPTRALETITQVTGLEPLDETQQQSSSKGGKNKNKQPTIVANVDPASFLIEIASEEYGSEAIDKLHAHQRDQFYRIHRAIDLQRDNIRRAHAESENGLPLDAGSINLAFRHDIIAAENRARSSSRNSSVAATSNKNRSPTPAPTEEIDFEGEFKMRRRRAMYKIQDTSTHTKNNNHSNYRGCSEPSTSSGFLGLGGCLRSITSYFSSGGDNLKSASRQYNTYNYNQYRSNINNNNISGNFNSKYPQSKNEFGGVSITVLADEGLEQYTLRGNRTLGPDDVDDDESCNNTCKYNINNNHNDTISRHSNSSSNYNNHNNHNNNNNHNHYNHNQTRNGRNAQRNSITSAKTTSSSSNGSSSGGSSRPYNDNLLYISEQLLHTRDSNHGGKFWSHTITLTRRTFLTTRRDPLLMTSRVLFHLMIPILMAHVYGQSTGKANACPNYEPEIDITQIPSLVESKRVESMLEELHMSIENVSMFFIIMYAFSAAVLALNALSFPLNMQVLLKETRNSWYSMSSYVVAKTLADLPLELTMPSITMALVYPLTGQPSSYLEWRMLTICLIMTLCSLIAQTQALIIGAVVMNSVQTAVFVSQASQLPWVILAGFTIRIKRLSEPLKLVSLTSFYRLGCEAITLTRYGFNICPCNPKEITGEPVKLVGIPDQVRVMAQYWLDSRASDSSSSSSGASDFASNDTNSSSFSNPDYLDNISSTDSPLFGYSSEDSTTSTSSLVVGSLQRTARHLISTTLRPSQPQERSASSYISDAISSVFGSSDNSTTSVGSILGINSNNNSVSSTNFDLTNSSSLISPNTLLETTTSVSTTTAVAKADIFQHLANQLSFANSYGVNITSCNDVTPDRIRAIGLDDSWLVARIWHLILMLLIMKIILYYAVTISIRIRL